VSGGGGVSDELLNLNEELDVEGHIKKDGTDEEKDEGEVEAHLLDTNLLDRKLLLDQELLDL
jgi:hypothetical protein